MLSSYFYVVVGSCLRVVMNSIYALTTLTTPHTCMERWTYFLSVVIEQHFENVHFDWLNGTWLKKIKTICCKFTKLNTSRMVPDENNTYMYVLF